MPYASVVEEYAGASTTPSARYDYGDDLVRMDRGSGVYYYIYDGLGSTRQLVSTTGAVTDGYAYSAFGEMASRISTGTPTVNPFLFNAQQFDQASGTYYLRARYYDQSNGRFISQDPFAGQTEDPITLHRYLYASCDPVNRVDPGGEFDGSLTGLSAALTIGVTFAAQNFSVIQNAFTFVVGLFDPNAAISLDATLPQAAAGGEAGLAVRGTFNNALELAREETEGLGLSLEREFVSQASAIRQSLNLKPKQRNIGIARYDLQTQAGNLKGDIAAISGTISDKGFATFRSQPFGQTIFTATEVANQGGSIPLLRDVDSEFKILEELARTILGKGGSRHAVVGTIELYTGRLPCTSCSAVISKQFKQVFPNVEFKLYTNPAFK